MRVLLSTYGSRGDVEPLAAFAVRLKELGAEVRVCAPPDEDFARLLDAFGVPLVPVGPSARELTKAAPPAGGLPERAARLIADHFTALPPVAEDCDVLVATGLISAAAGAMSVAELVGIRSQYVAFQKLSLPSAHHAPLAYPGRPHPPGVTDNRALWEIDRESLNVLFGPGLNASRAAHGLPAVDDVREYVVGKRPWLATDRVLDPWVPDEGLDVVQTGAWLLPDERPLADDLAAFLADGEPPVYVGFGSMPMHAAADVAEVAVAAVRAHGRRLVLKRGWAGLTVTGDDVCLVDEVNHQALFPRTAAVVHHGGAGTTTTATRAGVPQVVVPQATDQPYWAGRVAALGTGVAHDGPAPTVESLTTALGAALAMRDRAAEVAALVGTDGTETAAKLLLGPA